MVQCTWSTTQSKVLRPYRMYVEARRFDSSFLPPHNTKNHTHNMYGFSHAEAFGEIRTRNSEGVSRADVAESTEVGGNLISKRRKVHIRECRASRDIIFDH